MEPLIGWYSEHQAKNFGYAIYTDKDGLEIKITETTRNGSKPAAKWNDIVCVGEVFKLVKPNERWLNQEPFDIQNIEKLYNKVQMQITEQNNCQKQFPLTKNCYCHTCKIDIMN